MNIRATSLTAADTATYARILLVLLAFTAGIAIPASALDAQGLPQPNWDAAAALEAADQASRDAEPADHLSLWLQEAETGRADQLLIRLQQSTRTGQPAFEAQLQRLAIHLAEAPLDAAVDELLRWLMHYPSAVLVPHEENARYGVALFPVAASAQGSLAERERRRTGQSSASALEADVRVFLDAYRNSQGADTVQLLREAGWRLDAAQRGELFENVMALPASEKTALVISMLAPELQANPAVSGRLLNLLDDPELGAAAALALAGHPDPKVQVQLQEILRSGGVKAQRAALALDIELIRNPSANLQQTQLPRGDQP
jgi:hypothetical protein